MNHSDENTSDINATKSSGSWQDRFVLIDSILFPTIYGIVFIVGLIGNATLIYMILANKAMRTKSNVLIVSLAAGDFLLILVSVPFAALLYTTDGWWYGQVMCKLYEFLQTFSLAVSVLTLTALSGDRFVAIVFPLYVYKSGTTRRIVCITAVIWIVSLLLAVPDLLSAYVKTYRKVPYCYAYHYDWGQWYVRFRVVFRFVVLFACPLVVTTVFYSAIAVSLLCRSHDTFATVPGGEAAVRQLKSRRKVANIVLMFVVIFAVCWLPRHTYLLVWHFTDIYFNPYLHVFKATGFCLTFVYSAVNPFVLYFINTQFRQYFQHYLCGRCVKSRRLPTNADRRRSTLTSTTGQLMITQQNITLEDLMDRVHRDSLAPPTTQSAHTSDLRALATVTYERSMNSV